MRTVYAFQCEVLPASGQSVRQCLEANVREAEAWLQNNLRAMDAGPAAEPVEVPVVRAVWEEVGGRAAAALEWQYPDEKDETLHWTLGVVLAGAARWVEFSMVMGFTSLRFQVRPVAPVTLNPSLVPQLVAGGRCQVNGQPVPTSPRLLPAGDVARFVRNQLANPRRALPVVMLSTDPASGKPTADPEPLQQRLLGFAEVVVLADHDAEVSLFRCLGPKLACAEGLVRLYWPGFDGHADPHCHPFQGPEQVARAAAQGEPLDRGLLRVLIAAAADRVCPARLSEFDQEPQPAAVPSPAEPALPLPEVDGLRAAINRLEGEAAAARQEAAGLRQELAQCRAQLAAAWAVSPPPLPPPQPRPAVKRPRKPAIRGHHERRFASVAEALAAVGQQCDDVLTIWEDATQAARRCDSNRAGAVFRALEAVAQVGRLYFKARQAGRPMGAIDAALARRVPFKYTARESPTTLSQFGTDRIFSHDGRSCLMQRHLTLARGDYKNCVQIYFEFDDARQRVDVGYCGKHLPIAGQPT